MLKDDSVPVADVRCTVPGCTVSGDVPTTCVCWDHRLCYPHFSGYYSWSEDAGVINRAPTPAEWRVFLAWLAAKKPAESEAA